MCFSLAVFPGRFLLVRFPLSLISRAGPHQQHLSLELSLWWMDGNDTTILSFGIFAHLLMAVRSFCWDSCALVAISGSLSTAMNDWPIRALLPFYRASTVPRSAEADKQQMRCPVDDAAVTQLILLLFLNRKRRAERKQGLGNAKHRSGAKTATQEEVLIVKRHKV